MDQPVTDQQDAHLAQGGSRPHTVLTMLIHLLHPLMCIVNYQTWAKSTPLISENVRKAYLGLTIISFCGYMLVSSGFYMWAYKLPEPDELAIRRRVYGVVTNLVLSDFPIFLVEVQLMWSKGWLDSIQGATFLCTLLSLLYSLFRIAAFLLVKKQVGGGGLPPIHAQSRGWDGVGGGMGAFGSMRSANDGGGPGGRQQDRGYGRHGSAGGGGGGGGGGDGSNVYQRGGSSASGFPGGGGGSGGVQPRGMGYQ
jgi:hypothetical protein